MRDERRRLNLGDTRLKTALAGLAWCGACGGRLVSAPMRPGRKDRRLKCAATDCGKVARAVTPVDTWVRASVLFWLGDGGAYAAYVATLAAAGGQEEAAARAAELTTRIDALQGQIEATEAAAATVGADPARALGIIGGLTAQQDSLRVDRRVAEEAARAAAAPRPGDDDGIDWDAAGPAERRDWLRRYVARVVISPRRPGPPQRFDPAVIEVIPGPWWTAPGHPGYPPYTAPAAPPKAPPRPCDLAESHGCDRPHEGRGLCRLHNRRRWEAERAGHPDDWDRSPLPHRGKPAPGTPPRLCDLPGCGRPHEGHGLCNGHLLRQRTAAAKGTPDEWDRSPIPPRATRGTGRRRRAA